MTSNYCPLKFLVAPPIGVVWLRAWWGQELTCIVIHVAEFVIIQLILFCLCLPLCHVSMPVLVSISTCFIIILFLYDYVGLLLTECLPIPLVPLAPLVF